MFSRMRTAIFRQLTPPRIFILSFALVILIGAVLLRMPFAAPAAAFFHALLPLGFLRSLLPSFFHSSALYRSWRSS